MCEYQKWQNRCALLLFAKVTQVTTLCTIFYILETVVILYTDFFQQKKVLSIQSVVYEQTGSEATPDIVN